MNCLLHIDRPGSYVSVRLGQPMRLWLCDPDIAVWRSRGLEVTEVEAGSDADGPRALANGGTSGLASTSVARSTAVETPSVG